MNEGDALPTHEQLLDRWLEDVYVLVARLEQVHLPDDFPFDYSPASLAALEQVMVDEGADEAFRQAATGYIGEVLMDVCGGRWDIDPASGKPVVRPDPALRLEPLSIGIMIDIALAEQCGEALTRERESLLDAVAGLQATVPDWKPVKERSPLDPIGPQPEDPWLTGWLADRHAAFPAWLATVATPTDHPAWDFSTASLDRLEQLIRTRYATVAEFDTEASGPFLQQASWYLGQVVCLQADSVWLYWAEDPEARRGSQHHPDNPWSGIPFTHQPHKRKARPIDPAEALRGLLRYGVGYRLRNLLC